MKGNGKTKKNIIENKNDFLIIWLCIIILNRLSFI